MAVECSNPMGRCSKGAFSGVAWLGKALGKVLAKVLGKVYHSGLRLHGAGAIIRLDPYKSLK